MLHFVVYPRIQPAPNAPSSHLRPFFSPTYNILFPQLLSCDIHTKNTRGVGSKSAVHALRTVLRSEHRAGPFLRHYSLPTTLYSLTPLESALPQNAPVTPLQSADPKTKHLKSFRIRRSEKTWGEGGDRLTSGPSLLTVHYRLLPTSSPSLFSFSGRIESSFCFGL